jgi:hypothetical protein
MMAAPRRFPLGSIRLAVAVYGDNWALAFDDLTAESRNPHFVAELRDVAAMRAAITSTFATFATGRTA